MYVVRSTPVDIGRCVLLTNTAEQRRSRDNSASPPPTAVQTQQPQSTHAQVTAAEVDQQETVSSADDTGTWEITALLFRIKNSQKHDRLFLHR